MTLKLYAMTCGWINGEMNNFLAGEPGRISIPVPSYLIEHPKGRVLFDTGMHPATQTDLRGRAGDRTANAFTVTFHAGEEIKGRLESLDIAPSSINYIINSHLHWDHTGGNELIPDAKVVIQKREWEAGQVPELIEANSFNPVDYRLGHQVMQIDGEHDLFGDGSVVIIPSYGHTPGHQSLKVRTGSGEIVLTADACYMRRTLEELHLPTIYHDAAQMLETLKMFRRLRAGGARIFVGHDPAFWQDVPQAPAQIG
ncbi:MAG: N-acyl homoserine lactonase family protein [Alphaproteobacteria bacterium]